MLKNLSLQEQATLAKLAMKGSGGSFDQAALNKLFKLGLIEVDSNRRVVLTQAGQTVLAEIERFDVMVDEQH